MRPFPSTCRAASTLAVRAALVLAAVGLFAACDGHSADEVPENYGHGSSHERKTPDHQADSTGHDHFSDTVGLPEGEAKKQDNEAKPAPSVTGKGF